ncbi:uncharacterized protein LOC118438891 isoform X1 [Folsomia candida]|uniref:uncharacterized protein LOC118438891 isoform X1 n=1 Tax=Folsomia candida TaxID=158441 RepID=UPI001604B216|nr:uncharacterized protein LOC118438891 isoform X1 [Folsomia candida]
MSSNNSFVLVKFEETDEVEVVSTAWLRQNNKKCAWPNYKNSNRLAKAVSLHEPVQECWSLHTIKLLGSGRQFVSYHDALSKLPKVLDQSDAEINSDGGRKSRKSNKNTTYSDSSDDEVNNPDSFTLPPPPVIAHGSKDTDKINKLIFDSAKKYDPPHSSPIPFTLGLVGVENLGTTSGTISDSNSSPDHVLNEIQVPATTEYRNDNGGDNRDDSFIVTPLQNCHPDKDFQNWVARNITILKAQNRQIQNSLDGILLQLGDRTEYKNSQPKNVHHELPCKTLDDVENGKKVYSSSDSRESLVQYLGQKGGKSVSSCTRKVLSCLCTDKLACNYNWIGSRGGKVGFKETWMKSIILGKSFTNSPGFTWSIIFLSIDSVRLYHARKSKQVTDDEVEEVMKEWLKTAPKRLKPTGRPDGFSGNEHIAEDEDMSHRLA